MSTTSQWRSGERVLARGERWTIADTSPFDSGIALRLCGAGPSNFNRVRTLLTPFDRPRLLSVQPRWRAVRPRGWLHAIRRAALDAHPFGGLRAAAGARIELMPYQLEPALAVWRHGATRVLIADDVGLGKTVQAGLILRECAARCDGMRALILAPAGLRDQWARELRDLFDLPATQADAGWLRRAARELPPDVNPWSLPGIFIASFDFAKRLYVQVNSGHSPDLFHYYVVADQRAGTYRAFAVGDDPFEHPGVRAYLLERRAELQRTSEWSRYSALLERAGRNIPLATMADLQTFMSASEDPPPICEYSRTTCNGSGTRRSA